MGSSKPLLEWHGSTLVRRVAGIVARGVSGPVLLVRSPGQWLPSLPDAFEVLDDLEEGRARLADSASGWRHWQVAARSRTCRRRMCRFSIRRSSVVS